MTKRYSDGAMRAAEQIMAEGSHPTALNSCARTISEETGDLDLLAALEKTEAFLSSWHDCLAGVQMTVEEFKADSGIIEARAAIAKARKEG